jgi:hypothetical protein
MLKLIYAQTLKNIDQVALYIDNNF